MAEGKWLPELTAETPVEEAARLALAARFGAVRLALPLASEKATQDIEHVHQLRVATRRAAAALRTFADLLPEKHVRRARKVLRSIRRSASAARDWDVFLLGLLEPGTGRSDRARSGIDFLIGYALCHRAEAQAELVEVANPEVRTVTELCTELPKLATRNQKQTETLQDRAMTSLPPRFEKFDLAVRSGPESADALHGLRIAGKRLRYSMELFAGCFPPPFREHLYPLVERSQSILGAVQDAHVAIDRLSALTRWLGLLPAREARRIEPGVAMRLREVRRRLKVDLADSRSWQAEWKELFYVDSWVTELTEVSPPRSASGKGRRPGTRSRSGR